MIEPVTQTRLHRAPKIALLYRYTCSMIDLVQKLADLSSLRDREALDFALVKLLVHVVQGELEAVRLLRVVGELGDQRWQNCATLEAGQEVPSRDRVWVDFNTLPNVKDYPDRQTCLMGGEIQREPGSPSLTIFPLGQQGKVEGVLEFQTPVAMDAQSEHLVTNILRIFLNVQGLLDYGEKDSLTELLNRKTFDGAFIKASMHDAHFLEMEQPDRRHARGGSYWLAVLDIDHFKRVNDGFGHLIGDEVLVLIARLMRLSFRFNDQLYRFGGEEFVVLMRCTNANDAQSALERFRLRVEQHDFPQVGHITISIGYAPLMADDTPGAGFDRADKAVYFAKGNGRNQVRSYTELVASGDLVEVVDDSHEADFF